MKLRLGPGFCCLKMVLMSAEAGGGLIILGRLLTLGVFHTPKRGVSGFFFATSTVPKPRGECYSRLGGKFSSLGFLLFFTTENDLTIADILHN